MSNEPFSLFKREDYFPAHLCDTLRKHGNDLRKQGQLDVFGFGSWMLKLETFVKPLGYSMIEKVRRLSLMVFDIGLQDIAYDCSLYARLESGGRHTLHADAMELDGSPNHTAHRMMSMIVYLSTADAHFTGGDIVFPLLSQTISPKSGLMLAFPATLAYQHEVLPVTSGVRDSIVIFFKSAGGSTPDYGGGWNHPTDPAPPGYGGVPEHKRFPPKKL